MSDQLKDLSKKNWTGGDYKSFEAIQCSALMRIADASEIMAKNYIQLQNDRDRYERWWNEERAHRQRLERRIISLRGVITKLRKKVATS